MTIPAPQPTRQQLDDLDALLQRMLSLPVSLPDEETPAAETIAPPSQEPRAQPTLAAIPPRPADVLPSAPGNLVLADPLSTSAPVGRVSGGPPQPTAPAQPPTTPPAPWLSPVIPEIAQPSFIARSPLPTASRPPDDSPLLMPLLWCNRLFDRLALGLGAPGHWLRGPVGRNLLGLLGLLLLLTALSLVLLDHYELAQIGWARIMP
jgi:hypothetical protein